MTLKSDVQSIKNQLETNGVAQEWRGWTTHVTCPFCGMYFFEGEKRPSRCLYCNGEYGQAAVHERRIKRIMDKFHMLSTADRQLVCDAVGLSYYGFELRHRHAYLSKKEESNDPT